MPDWLIDGSAWVIPVVLAVTMHEAAHGLAAGFFGDETARKLGRVSINPLRHVDKFGTIIFPSILILLHAPFTFGYAKPVPVNFPALRPQRIGMAVVALAGPFTNLLLAIITGILLFTIGKWVTPEHAPWLFQNLYRSLIINCVLSVFNLLPILPLDGGRVVASLLRGKPRKYFDKVEPFGVLIVMAVLLVPTLLGYNMALEIMGKPTFWLLRNVMELTGNGA